MEVIGFFQSFTSQLADLLRFIIVPLGEQFPDITIEPFKSASIVGLLGVGLVATLATLLVVHIIRLFIGG